MNKLYFGDNLHVLRKHVADESVDLVYLDPPFNSNADYNLLFKATSGRGHRAQIEAFDDTWHWGKEAEEALDTIRAAGGAPAAIARALREALGPTDMMAYIVMMAVRLVELHRVLKHNGSLYLHCDPTACHYLKLVMDGIFGVERFRNEIVWKRTTTHSDSKTWSRVADNILFYTKGKDFTWNNPRETHSAEYLAGKYTNLEGDRRYMLDNMTSPSPRPNMMYDWKGFPYPAKGWRYSKETMARLDAENRVWYPTRSNGSFDTSKRPRLKRYLDEMSGGAMGSVWTDIAPVNSQARERIGYPTQKPVSLLKRILEASTNHGDVVLDPFCGCGTTVQAAQQLGRAWIGIDITHLAIQVIADRLKQWTPSARFDVHGQPRDLAGALKLAEIDKYQFQWWATWLCGGQPAGGGKKGADGGVDGTLEFATGRGQHDWGIVSVKGGKNVGVDMVRQLEWAVRNEGASMGVLVTLAEPTREMDKAAVTAGFVELGGHKYRRVQIRTIEQLLEGKAMETPHLLTTVQETPAKSTRGAGRRLSLSPEDALKQRNMLLPITGGRGTSAQAELPLSDPLRAVGKEAASRPRRRAG